jgi:hypothetical protein
MILKSHRLSNAFVHYFIPESGKLLSPQNIKIELWDLTARKIEAKFHPGLFCISAIAFSKNGDFFVCRGGCYANNSEFGIYDTATLQRVSAFSIAEDACNPVVSADARYIYFGTSEGNLFRHEIASGKLDKVLQFDQCMISVLATDSRRERLAFVVRPIVRTGENWPDADFILIHDLATQRTERADVPLAQSDWIRGVAMTNDNLSCMVDKIGMFVAGSGVTIASLYVLALPDKNVVYRKEEFMVRDTFSTNCCMSWSADERLTFIGLDEVFVLDMKNGEPAMAIPFPRPSSVSFSNCGTAVAIGGDKAMLCKL